MQTQSVGKNLLFTEDVRRSKMLRVRLLSTTTSGIPIRILVKLKKVIGAVECSCPSDTT